MRTIFRGLLPVALAVVCAGCATRGPQESEQRFTATSLEVDARSEARVVISAVPPESAMERFGMIDRRGQLVSYVGFTDTAYGGLVFIDGALLGHVWKRDGQAFYSCRGYYSASHYHWARDATEWADGLIAATVPADRVTLDFSGKSTVQSIREVVGNPVLSDVKSLVDMGTSPLSIIRTLTSARSNMVKRERYEKNLQALRILAPGDSEEKVASIVRPEDLSFTSDGMVLAYPRYSLDFYVNAGIVKVIQQPSFHRLSRSSAAIFYVPDLRWDRCTPSTWREALPRDWKLPAHQDDESYTAILESKLER